MPQVNGLFHGDVPPVRHLNSPDDAADCEEGGVVFKMDLHGVLGGHRTTKMKRLCQHCRSFKKSSVKTSAPYLAELGHVAERSVLEDLVILAGVAQLCVALHSFGGQADACGLTAGGVRGVQVVVALKDHQLALCLSDVCGEGLQDVAEHHLHLGFQLRARCQTGQQLHLIKLTAVWEQTRHTSHTHTLMSYFL